MSLAGRVLRSLTEPYDLPTHSLTVGASIGTALAPGHGTSPDDLLKNADIALYRAKSCGRGNAVFFRAEHEQELLERRSLEADLRLALQNDEFHLVYQPIIDLQCGRVSACEALIRWRHPRRGLVSPANFIPIAEETGLISPIGEWALRRACRDAAAWPGHIRVAVNLSAVQFTSSDLYAIAAAALEDGGLPADRLELEVTETLLLQNDAATLEVLHKLRALGVSIALDDFGTGFASLSYLRNFHFDKIKIDQTFVRDLPVREDCAAIVSAVCGLSRLLDMRTVAEGVETQLHLERVAAAGCNEAQGYHFSRPVSGGEVATAIIASEKILAKARLASGGARLSVA